MKKHPEISNPWALAWWEKNRGEKSHYTKTGKKKNESTAPAWYDEFHKDRTDRMATKKGMADRIVGKEDDDPSGYDDARYSDDAINALAAHNRQQRRLAQHKERIQQIRSRYGR